MAFVKFMFVKELTVYLREEEIYHLVEEGGENNMADIRIVVVDKI